MDEVAVADGPSRTPSAVPTTRGYQQEMLNESMHNNIIIALDTGSGKTLIAVLRMKHEMEREATKISWFFAPTVALCEQQKSYIEKFIPVSVGIVSGANEPDQWKNAALWERVISTHRIIVSTPQVFLDALRHGYILLGRDISLIVFDEAHHAVDNHPYNRIMMEFYFNLPPRDGLNVPGIVRPMILGLTASPIYGGNVEKAFKTIESNLNSIIRAPRRHRSELAEHVHRPIFKHAMYDPTNESGIFSTNVAALSSIISTLDIENDPYVISLRSQLRRHARGTYEYNRVDQKLSKVIEKQNSFTHKGLRDFERAAIDICQDLGPWAADWFVWKVLGRAKEAADPYKNIMASWKNTEKSYLLGILSQIIVSPVSYYPEDIEDDVSDKTRALIDCLLLEKAQTESLDDTYSSIIFVQRRDAVLALAELLKHHPATKDVFDIGTLLGTSDSMHRHSMMDITRSLVRESQDDTLSEFKSGEKNLIVSTAVAEEGIDIQACGSVVRWDPPPNMASWAQSRGRARKKRSTFTVMFERGSKQQADVKKWEDLERQMVALYNDPSRDLMGVYGDDPMDEDDGEEDNDTEFTIASTGATLTLHSAISHLTHFCAVIPNSAHVDNRPLYDIDPSEFPEGWHAFSPEDRAKEAYAGPYGSKVTLPRTLPLPERQFSVDRVYKSIISAHRHAAFKAYMALYHAGLLNDHLLPITSIVEPELEEEVKTMLADVEKRAGLAKVSIGLDPWAPEDVGEETWHCSELRIDSLAPLLLFTRTEYVSMHAQEGPVLYRPGEPPIRTSIFYMGAVNGEAKSISRAREYTRTLFWGLNSTRMNWDDLDFAYLFLPAAHVDAEWDARRSWLATRLAGEPQAHRRHMMVRADVFGRRFEYPSDVTLVQKHMSFGRPFKFVGWRYDPLSEEEEAVLRESYKTQTNDNEFDIVYPLLVVQAYPPRCNFLIPIISKDTTDDTKPVAPTLLHLLPQHSGIILLSPEETEYAFLLPSVLRFFSMSMTAHSLRQNLFSETPLSDLSIPLLTVALTAPSSGERLNYQRLETLGDTVLKFIAGIQLLAEYPLWHEGYLSRKKDHAVSNVRLAKEDISKGVYRWIIRDIMLGKKWKPRYFTAQASVTVDPPTSAPQPDVVMTPAPEESTGDAMDVVEDKKADKDIKKKKKKNQQLSTKVLADVVESIVGAAYLHGGFDMGYESLKFFGLGLKWQPLADRIPQLLARVDASLPGPTEPAIHFPRQLEDVERMLGYTFERKLLLIEALTHASYQNETRTPSYERMEFLGDSVLDMIVTDFLYHAPGKNYSPGHMHLRKSAVVNGHILAYICLKTSTVLSSVMPHPAANGVRGIEVVSNEQEIHLWQCLLHSSQIVLDDQRNTFARFKKRNEEIGEALMNSTMFPWAALTRLHAPKFLSDMIESIIGSIFLDSYGSISTVRSVLDRLGVMPLLAHIVNDNVDVLHPVSRLSMWASKHDKEIRYDVKKERGSVSCAIVVDGKEEVRVEEPWRGKASQEEVKYAAAEMAIGMFKLRNVGANYELLKKKKAPRPKRNSRKDKAQA